MANFTDKELLKALKSNPDLLQQVKGIAKGNKKDDQKRYDKNGKILNKGETIYRNKYRYTWTDQNGERQNVYSYTLDDLRRKERRIQKDIENGIVTNEADSVTIGMMWDKFSQQKKQTVRSKTYISYCSAYNNHIKNELGNKKIRSIRYTDVVNFYLSIIEKTDCSFSTLHTVHIVLSVLFKLAIKDNYITQNPCDDALNQVKDKCKKPKKIEALTVPQQNNLLAFISDSRYYKHWLPFITVQLLTGMRISEMCGLTWDDVDFEKNEIHVNRSLQKYKTEDEASRSIHIGDPKTEAGKRMIVMAPEVRIALLNEKSFQDDLELQSIPLNGYVNGKNVIVKDFCFLKVTGLPYDKDEVNHSLRRIKEAYNKQETEKASAEHRDPVLIDHLSSHMLRHTFSTRCVENDMNIKVVQSIMGHEDIKTTMNIYTDVKDEKIHEEFEKMEMFKLS